MVLPALILGISASWFITLVIIAILVILLFLFSTMVKIIVLLLGIYIIYKYLPPNLKKFSNFEFGVMLSALFTIILVLGKGSGFLSIGGGTLNPVISSAITPLNLSLVFIIVILGLMYLNARKKRRR